jgi:mono/diheme cytochrome c family protein
MLLALLALAAPPADGPKFFEAEVRPLLVKHCLKCHGENPEKLKGGFALTGRAAVLAGGDTGPAVDLAKPADSLLLHAINHTKEGYDMPPSGKLPAAERAVFAKWVALGLPWGGDEVAVERKAAGPDMGYWAWQPVVRPAVPPGAANPIDAFLTVRRDAAGLTPNPPADKLTLCRRAYYDLHGLPPTPEQLDAFLADRRPDAFARLVDELLASPHYGEKWGRHWLDLVRFAETNSFERDGPKPFAWKYRDYVIRSFNRDTPYPRFLAEQLAGDELDRDDPDCVIATGFYRLGLWDDEPADPELARMDQFDDYVTTVGQAVLGLSLNCARCHDHKGDFFPQADYYRLVAFFRDIPVFSDTRDTSSKFNLTDITPKSKRALYEDELANRQAETDALKAKLTALEGAAIRRMPAEDQRASEGPDRPQVLLKVPGFLTDAEKPAFDKLKRELAALRKKPLPHQELALSVNHCARVPEPTHVLIRGNAGAKGKEVQPGFPTVFRTPDPAISPTSRSSGRRTALARWLGDPANPLPARVMANRVWQHHFGRGLVPTPNDFGKLGEPPTHPELLDFLAAEFVANGWALKPLHRLVMASAAYQMSGAARPDGLTRDPGNKLRWRFDSRRLAAEEVRDTLLAVSGRLKLDVGGPSVFPKIPQAVLQGQSVPGGGWLKGKGGGYDPADPRAGDRRSVYVFAKRSLQVPILATHDQADTDATCPVRYTTTVPTQALGMLNGEFLHEQADALADRLEREHPGDVPAQVRRAVRLTTGRPPDPAEVAADVRFVGRMQAEFGLTARRALARYALVCLNASAVVYVD